MNDSVATQSSPIAEQLESAVKAQLERMESIEQVDQMILIQWLYELMPPDDEDQTRIAVFEAWLKCQKR